MANHVWSVLCERSYLDRDSNNILLASLEQLNVTTDVLPELDGTQPVFIGFRHEIVTFWDQVEDPSLVVRIRVECPDGRQRITPTAEFQTEGKRRLRARIRSENIPFGGEGRYLFHVEARFGDDFQVAASLPLYLVVQDTAQKPEE